MYLVAGLVIEAVTGKTWDDFVKEKIFTPLSMHISSTSISQLSGEHPYAHPHIKNKPIALLNIDNMAPAGSINSSVKEMLNWLQMWINEGSWNGKEFLSVKTYQTITSPKTMISNNSDESYGFGWQLGKSEYGKIISHGGGLPGYKSSVTILPEHSIAIIILANKITYLHEELTGVILDFLLNPERTNWQKAKESLYFKNFNYAWDEEREVDTTLQANNPFF